MNSINVIPLHLSLKIALLIVSIITLETDILGIDVEHDGHSSSV